MSAVCTRCVYVSGCTPRLLQLVAIFSPSPNMLRSDGLGTAQCRTRTGTKTQILPSRHNTCTGMSICVFLAALILSPRPADVTTFTDPYLGLTFSHPNTWKLKPKGKRDVGLTFLIPGNGSAQSSSLEIIRTSFQSAPELWQTIQLRANEQMKRTVRRQWEQELLGVPLLLTQAEFDRDGTQCQSLTGLLYAKGPQKLLFRLIATSSEFDNVKYQFQSALETLRTTDGALPKVEDGTQLTGPVAKPTLAPVKHALTDQLKTKKWVFGPVHSDLTVSTRQITISLPLGWKYEKIDAHTLSLSKEGLMGPVVAKIFTTLDSDSPVVALAKESALTLEGFDVVEIRDDVTPYVNRAGAGVTETWRKGKGKTGPIWSLNSLALQGDWYVLLSCGGNAPQNPDSQRAVLKELVGTIGVEQRP